LLQLVTKRAQQFQTDAFFVTTKKWRLVVTPLSGTTSLHQLEVEAPNWMGALRAARKEMGEGGGLPSGASCAVAPDGTVTILDSESRRKFLLTPGAVIVPKPAEPAPSKNGKAAELPEKKQAFQTMGYEAVRAIVAPPPARHDLEVLITRDEDPTPDNPLTYRERAYLIPKGMSVSEAEAGLRFTLADLQTKLAATPRGKFVNLAAFDHRWVDQPQRPPLVVLEWRDWRGEPAVDYPAAERAASTAPREGLEFIVRLLDTTVPATAIAACLYDINTDELRFVALTGPGEAELRGTAIPRNRGLFGRAASMDQGALLIRSVADEPGYDAVSDGRPGLKPHNMLLRPLVHDGRLLGLLQLIDRTTGAFSAPDQHLVNYAADRLAAFLREARDRVVRP
jgi:putative methionine-R-sulfoxide reductase with GAF domain